MHHAPSRRRRALLLALSAAAVACNAAPGGDEAPAGLTDALGVVRPPPTRGSDQSFLTPASWSKDFAASTGWNPQKHVRVLADIDHDGKKDIVGFGDAGVYVARLMGASFEGARFVVADFGTANGWSNDKHVRTMADVNGDGLADIVAFGDAGVWTALSTGASFASPRYVLADFGYDQGWRVEKHVRTMADVDGDGLADIVGFGDAGVYVSIASAAGFGPASFVVANFGANQGWDPSLQCGRPATSTATAAPIPSPSATTAVDRPLDRGVVRRSAVRARRLRRLGGGRRLDRGRRHERRVVDIDGDRKADIVGFGESGTYVAHATGGGGFGGRRSPSPTSASRRWATRSPPRRRASSATSTATVTSTSSATSKARRSAAASAARAARSSRR